MRNTADITCLIGNLRKMSEKCSETFALTSEKFWNIFGNLRKRSPYIRKNVGTSSEIFGNWSENRQKRRH